METRQRPQNVESVLGRPFAGPLQPPVLDLIQWGTLKMRYRDVPLYKSPFDLALYTLLIGQLRPATVIEIGTAYGASALWFADMLSAHGIVRPRVLSIDTKPKVEFSDERIDFIVGDARRLDAVLEPHTVAGLERPWLAIDDGSHRFGDLMPALDFFHRHLTPGDYLVVEDGNLSQLSDPSYLVMEDGPNRAVAAFLEAHPEDYEIDVALCDHFGYNVTNNPNGWLRRL